MADGSHGGSVSPTATGSKKRGRDGCYFDIGMTSGSPWCIQLGDCGPTSNYTIARVNEGGSRAPCDLTRSVARARGAAALWFRDTVYEITNDINGAGQAHSEMRRIMGDNLEIFASFASRNMEAKYKAIFDALFPVEMDVLRGLTERLDLAVPTPPIITDGEWHFQIVKPYDTQELHEAEVIQIMTGVKSINSNPLLQNQFRNNLVIMTFPSTLESIDQLALPMSRKLVALDLEHTGVTMIGQMAFFGSKGLKSATFPATLEAIDPEAFGASPNLVTVDLGHTRVTAIGNKAFEGDKQLRSVTLPPTLKTIGVEAFGNCAFPRHALDMLQVTVKGRAASPGDSTPDEYETPASPMDERTKSTTEKRARR